MSVPPDPHTPRPGYLLDGRRVTLVDLLDAGLLDVGTRLRFERVRRAETHFAVVTADGHLTLDDGQTFRSPSRAAVVAAGVRAFDGWHAWAVDSSGRSLDSLRQELLDKVAHHPLEVSAQPVGSPLETPTPTAQRRHEFLKEARTQADTSNPAEITVRDLLAWWGADARGYMISGRIEADLANHGLTTDPSFRKVTVDTTVQLIRVAEEAAVEEDVAKPATLKEDDPEEPEMVLTVGNLPSALGGVVSVTPAAEFKHAITIMLLNDYSQLAVMSGPHNLRGAVTWKSIAQARHANPTATFSDAIIDAHESRYDKELIDILPTLEMSDFVFVRNNRNEVSGIVTTADVVHAYGELATPFFLIGELDQALRHVISKTFAIEEVAALCNPDGARAIESFDDLSMGDYQRVLENPVMWAKLGWPLDRASVIKRLDELREIRNDVMHFNPDPLPQDAVSKLRNALKLLHEYGD